MILDYRVQANGHLQLQMFSRSLVVAVSFTVNIYCALSVQTSAIYTDWHCFACKLLINSFPN